MTETPEEVLDKILDEAEALASEIAKVVHGKELSVVANSIALMMAKCARIAADKTGESWESCLGDITLRAFALCDTMEKRPLQ